MLALEAEGVDLAGEEPGCVYVAGTEADLRQNVFSTTLALRRAGIRTEADYQGRSLKAQFKQADKHRASLCVVIGPDEVAAGTATIRDMGTHEQTSVAARDLAARVQELLA